MARWLLAKAFPSSRRAGRPANSPGMQDAGQAGALLLRVGAVSGMAVGASVKQGVRTVPIPGGFRPGIVPELALRVKAAAARPRPAPSRRPARCFRWRQVKRRHDSGRNHTSTAREQGTYAGQRAALGVDHLDAPGLHGQGLPTRVQNQTK
jgi:hypothetical protein